MWFDATGKVIRSKDEKGAVGLSTFDTLHRNTHVWAKDNTGENLTLRQYLIYGDNGGIINPENENLRGQLYKHYDEAGLIEIPEYDFKGNALKSLRQVIADSEILSVLGGSTVNCYRVDWTGLPNILDAKTFETDSSFDALNRVTQMLYPEDVENERKELIPVYNRAGVLERIQLGGDDYVKHIAYNAKGQRLLIAYGNGVMTRYLYNNTTFRLMRQRSETYQQTSWQFDSLGNVKQDTAYTYDLAGNIVKTDDDVTGCGVGGTNHLTRNFGYDPLYRLLNATGRENAPDITPIWDDSYRSTDNSLTTAYSQNYQYDKLGNIRQLQHLGNNPFTRVFNYNNPSNKLQSVAIGMTNYTFAYDACGNQIQETASRFFEWDAANQLRSFYVDDGSNISQYTHYFYDAGGRRVKKLVWKQGGNYTSTTYANEVFEYLTDGTDEQNTLHIMDAQSRVALIRLGDDFGDTAPSVKYNLEDHLGSSLMQLADDGATINKEEYYAFGETSFGSYAKKRYKYCGKERDKESGLYYYGARYYSAWMCRFISIDPLAKEYSFYTPYQYAGNKPIIAIDIDGLEPGGTVDSIKPLRLYIVSSFNTPTKEHSRYNEPESWFSKGDSRAFFDAAYKVQQEHIGKYGVQEWSHQKRQKTYGAAQIVNYINEQPNDSIGSIDIWTHGSYEGLFSAEVYPAKSYGINELDKSKIIAKANLYTTEELLKDKGGESAKLASRTLESINYSKFTINVIIEIHGCDTAGGNNPSESFTAILSKKLFEAGKTEGVVIGHKGPAGPYYESYKGSENYGDYRQGERHVYWNGNLIYSTTQKGEITPEQIKNAIDNFKASIKK